jgi:hypothetical protein
MPARTRWVGSVRRILHRAGLGEDSEECCAGFAGGLERRDGRGLWPTGEVRELGSPGEGKRELRQVAECLHRRLRGDEGASLAGDAGEVVEDLLRTGGIGPGEEVGKRKVVPSGELGEGKVGGEEVEEELVGGHDATVPRGPDKASGWRARG